MFRKGDEPIPGYRLEKFLGKGQFGEVWKTTAPGGTSAALKFIDLGGKQGIKEFRGVQRVKEIRHANLMPITALWMLDGEGNILSDKILDTYDSETKRVQATLDATKEEDVNPEWLVVAMLLGRKNLADRLEECRTNGDSGVPVDELLRYMEEAAKGIDYLNGAHHDLGEGIVAIQHCDVKPANIMLIGDAAAVCDFGLARVLSDAAATATGMVGSPAYMAPECIGRKPGPGSDQYSLAVSYVELRTGQLPFKEITYLAVVEANRSGVLELSRLTQPEQQVIRKATSLKPEDRYPTTLEMVRALQRAVEGRTAPATVPTWLWVAAAVTILIALPTIAWLAVTKYWTDPVTDNVRTTTVSIVPADALVKLDGKDQKLSDGKLTVTLQPGEGKLLEATHPDNYARLQHQFNWNQSEKELTLKLQRNAQWYVKESLSKISQGEREVAAQLYLDAILLDPAAASPAGLELKHHTKAVVSIAISPDGKWIASAGDDGAVCVWTIATTGPNQKAEVLRESGQPIDSMDVSSEGRWLVAGGQDDIVTAWDIREEASKRSPIVLSGHNQDVTVVKVVPGMHWIASAVFDTAMRLWTVADGRPNGQFIDLIGHEAAVESIDVSGDGRWLVSRDIDDKILRWDLRAQPKEIKATKLPDLNSAITAIKLSPDGSWLVAGRRDGKIALLRLQEPDKWREFEAANDAVESLVFDQTGQHLYLTDAEGEIKKFDRNPDGQLTNLQTIRKHASDRVSVAISPDSSFAVSGSRDQTVVYWHVAADQKQLPLVLASNHGQVLSVAITPDSKWIVAACDDGTVLVWNAAVCDVIQQAIEKKGAQGKKRIEA